MQLDKTEGIEGREFVMIVYTSLIIWCFIMTFFYNHVNDRSKKMKSLLGILPMFAIFVVSAIRYNVGTDYLGTYTSTYIKLRNGIDAPMDIIPKTIYLVMAKYNLNPQWFFAITSFLISYFIHKCIFKYSKSVTLSYYLFICGCFLFFSYNAVRQSVAMSMFYYSLYYLGGYKEGNILEQKHNKKRKRILHKGIPRLGSGSKYMILNLIASGFHFSALIFLPLVCTLKKILKFKTKITIIICCIIVSNIGIPFILSLINRTRLSYYVLNSERFMQESLNLSMIINIGFFVFYELLYYKNDIRDDYDIIFGNIHFYGLLVTLFVTHIPLAYRVFYSFRYIEIFSIPNLLYHSPKKYKKLLTLGVYAFYLVYFMLMIGKHNRHDVLPYLTFFNKY